MNVQTEAVGSRARQHIDSSKTPASEGAEVASWRLAAGKQAGNAAREYFLMSKKY